MIKNKLIIDYYKLVNRKYMWILFLGLIISAIPVLVLTAYPFFLKEFVNTLSEAKKIDFKILFYFIGVFGISLLLSYIGSIIKSYGHLKSSLDLRMKVFENFMHLSKSEISRKGEAYYSRIINEDVAYSFNLFNEAIIKNIFDILRIIPVLIIVYEINAKSFFLFLGTLVFSFLSYYLNQKILPKRYKKIFETLGSILSFISESLNAVEIVKRYKYLKSRVNTYFNQSTDINRKYFNTFMISYNLDHFISKLPLYTLRIILIFILGKEYINERILLGDFIGIITYYSFVESPSSYISFISTTISQVKGNISRIVEYFNNTKEKIQSRRILDKAVYSKADKNFCFKLSNVSICLDSNPIIHNFSLIIPPNQVVGIVGLSGAGKSTLLNTLLGINEQYDGDIYYLNESINIKTYDLSLSLNYYPQDSCILNVSLKNNIVMGNEFDEKLYFDIINKIGLSNFSEREFGYNGNFISGGEKQKITLARFLYNFLDTDNFVIDEPFVSLDELSKQDYLTILQNFTKNKSGFIISHDFNILLQLSDKIIFIDTPEKYFYGTHKELLDKSKNYNNLFSTFKNKFNEIK